MGERRAYSRWLSTFQTHQRFKWKLVRPSSATLEEWDSVKELHKLHYPTRYFFQKTLMHMWYKFVGRISRKYYWLKAFLFNPHNVLKIPTLPPTWVDSTERIPHLLFTELTNFIDRERGGEEGVREAIQQNLTDVINYYQDPTAGEFPYIRWMPIRDYKSDKNLLDAYMWWKEQKARNWAHGGPNIMEFVKDDRKPEKTDFDPPTDYQHFLPMNGLEGWINLDRKYYRLHQAEAVWNKERDEHLKAIITLKGAMWT